MLSHDDEENWSLPFEIIEMIDKWTDSQTHTRLRATCKHFRQHLPLEKVVNFKALEEIVDRYNIKGWEYRDRERNRLFQEQVHLDISPSSLTQLNYEFLCDKRLFYEVCRVSRAVLDNPSAYKHIDQLYLDCDSFASAALINDVELMQRLLLIPGTNPAADPNKAIDNAAHYGHLESVRFLLQVPGVDPTKALRWSCRNGQTEVCSLLLTDPCVLAHYRFKPIYLPPGVIVPPCHTDKVCSSSPL